MTEGSPKWREAYTEHQSGSGLVAHPAKYNAATETIDELQKLTTGISRAITKLKLKSARKK